METQRETPRYSYVYNALVKDEADFVGLVAYSIYKNEKIAHVRRFEAENGRSPKPEELQSFHAECHDRLDQYKRLATISVEQFYKEIYKQRRTEFEAEYLQKFMESVRGIKTRWYVGAWHSILGSFFYTILAGAVVFFLLYSQYNITWVVKNATDNQPVIEFPKK